MKIEKLETDTNIVIMKLRDFKNASNSREKYYKCWRKAEEQKELLEKENKRLNNIIKEVREYIMTNGIHSDYGDKGIDDENKLLEILDKGE